MTDMIILWEWLGFAIRWLHVITAISWIGSSFYFIALDLGLRRGGDHLGDADGEEWQVHGGGFYHIRKYLVAPAELPEHLIWFKWESYATWLSGAALLAVVYWAGAELFLIDPTKMDLAVWQAVAISAGSLVIGWVIYDRLCKSALGNWPTALMVLLFVVLLAMGWAYDQVFTGRAALLHLGAFTATIMTANVAMIIIPNQHIVVADLRAGRVPDAKYGKIAKLRSTHNNYLTLPVIFLMLSNHYPLAFASPWNWAIAGLVFLMGVTIRHYFNARHSRKSNPTWTWAVTVILFLLVVWLSTVPAHVPAPQEAQDARAPSPQAQRFADADGFDRAVDVVMGNCSMCHAREPFYGNMRAAPKGVYLETPADIARQAHLIFLQAGVSDAMPPPAAISTMDGEARAAIVAWYRSAAR